MGDRRIGSFGLSRWGNVVALSDTDNFMFPSCTLFIINIVNIDSVQILVGGEGSQLLE